MSRLEAFVTGFSKAFYGETENEMKARIYILSASLVGTVIAIIAIGIQHGRCSP